MRWRATIVGALVASACGKIGFDPIGSVPDGGAGDGATMSLGFRRHCVIVNGAASALPVGYTVRVGLAIDPGKSLPTYADVRVLADTAPTDGPGTPRVVEVDSPGQGPGLWFALSTSIAAGANQGFWLYYGNHAVLGSVGDPRLIFAFFDDFTGSGLSQKWLVQGTPATGTSLVLAPGDTGVATVAATAGIPALSALELRASISNPAGPGNCYFLGFQRGGDFVQSGPWINWVGSHCPNAGGDNVIHPWVNTTNANSQGADEVQDTAPHWFRIERGPGETRFYRDGALVFTVPGTDATVYAVELRNLSTTNVVTVSWVRARSLASPEPTIACEPEQPL